MSAIDFWAQFLNSHISGPLKKLAPPSSQYACRPHLAEARASTSSPVKSLSWCWNTAGETVRALRAPRPGTGARTLDLTFSACCALALSLSLYLFCARALSLSLYLFTSLPLLRALSLSLSLYFFTSLPLYLFCARALSLSLYFFTSLPLLRARALSLSL